MSCIHFKFSNTVENDKIKFDGLHISVSDLKEAIVKQKNLKSNLHGLRIIDSQTKKEYADAKEMIPRNTSVIVSRVPLAASQRIPKAKFKDPTIPQSDASALSKTILPGTTKDSAAAGKMLTAEQLKKTADLVNANATEEEKVKAMISQSGEGYDPSQYVWPAPRGAMAAGGIMPGLKKNPPPPNYICYRCGNRGHWIQLCPTNGDPTFNNYRFKRAMGTPSSQIVTVSENTPGAMLDRFGQLVIRAVDLKAIQDFKKKGKQPAEKVSQEVTTPPELICTICKELMKDAVIIPCCGESYCYDCIQDYLCEYEFTCPACKKDNISPDNLAPNKALRASAKNFQMKQAEEKSVAVASSTGFVKKSPVVTPQSVATKQLALPAASSTEKSSGDKVQPASSSDGDKSVPAAGAKVKVEEEAEVKKEGVAPAAAAPPPPEVVVEDATTPPEKTVESSAESAGGVVGEVKADALGVAVKKPDGGPKSRSGSPANVASPAAMAAAVAAAAGMKPSVSTSSLVSEVQPGHLTAAGSLQALPGMIPGVPLTASGLLSKSMGNPLGPASMLNSRQAMYPSQVLGMLPGQAGLVPTQSSTVPKLSDPSKLDRLAAELLLNSAVSKKRGSPSPPPVVPLSQEEFYRQQKLLKLFARKARRAGSGSSSSYSSGSSRSRSSSSGSSYSDSPRSRSRSPYVNTKVRSHHSSRRRHRHGQERGGGRKGHRSRERREKRKAQDPGRHASSSKRGKEGKSGRKERGEGRSRHRHGNKRKRHGSLSPSPAPRLREEEKGSKQKRSRRHHHHDSPTPSPSPSPPDSKKLALEEVGAVLDASPPTNPSSAVTPSSAGSQEDPGKADLLSPPSLPDNTSEEPSLKKHKHKRKSKKKHKHRRRSAEEEEEEEGEGGKGEGEGEKVEEAEAVTVVAEPPKSKWETGSEEEGEAEEGKESGTKDIGGSQDKEPIQDGSGGVTAVENAPDDAPSTGAPDGKGEEQEGRGTEGEEPCAPKREEPCTQATPPSGGDATDSVPSTDADSAKVEGQGSSEGVSVELEDSVEVSIPTQEAGQLATSPPPTQTQSEETAEKKESKPKEVDRWLTTADLAVILDELEPMANDWKSIGLELRVPGRKLAQIQEKHPVEGLEKAVQYWLDSSGPCTWRRLSEALKKTGHKSEANRISRKYTIGKEEGEISDSEEDSQKTGELPDLRTTLLKSSASNNEPDLRETLNSHKSKSLLVRKRKAARAAAAAVDTLRGTSGDNDNDMETSEEDGEEEEVEEEIVKVAHGKRKRDHHHHHHRHSSKRRKKISSAVANSVLPITAHEEFSGTDPSDTEDDSSSSSSDSEEEELVKKSSRKSKHSSSSKPRKHRSQEKHHSRGEREREHRREKKAKKEKKHKSLREHKHSSKSSSHKSKKSSRVERDSTRRDNKKVKKHKKSSSYDKHH